ncbi:hypothetical protein FRC08_000072 [Ceratobasidium sp. 394]|nr:hypothetical protein FRC08_000072 [Ceratobasidium sp. 394]
MADSLASSDDEREINACLQDLQNLSDRFYAGEELDRASVLARLPFITQKLADHLGCVANVGIAMHVVLIDEERIPREAIAGSHHFAETADDPREIESRNLVQQVFSDQHVAEMVSRQHGGLPVYEAHACFVPFNEAMLATIKDHYEVVLPGLLKLAKLANEYESMGPPLGEHGIFDLPATAPRMELLPNAPISASEFYDLLKQPLSDSFWNAEEERHDVCSPLPLRRQVTPQLFLDPNTKVHFGGPNGFSLAIGIMIRAASWALSINPNDVPDPCQMPVLSVKSYLTLVVNKLFTYLGPSHGTLKKSAHARERSNLGTLEFLPMISFSESRAAPAIPPLRSRLRVQEKQAVRKASPARVWAQTQQNLMPAATNPIGRQSASGESASRHSSAGAKRPVRGTETESTAAEDSAPAAPAYSPEPEPEPQTKRIKQEKLTVVDAAQVEAPPARRMRPAMKAIAILDSDDEILDSPGSAVFDKAPATKKGGTAKAAAAPPPPKTPAKPRGRQPAGNAASKTAGQKTAADGNPAASTRLKSRASSRGPQEQPPDSLFGEPSAKSDLLKLLDEDAMSTGSGHEGSTSGGMSAGQ